MRRPPEVWEQIKTAFATGSVGLRELARNMGIPAGTILARAKREGWTQQVKDAKALALAANGSPGAVSPLQAIGACLVDDSRILTLREKREYLADAVRTPVGKIDENSPLAHRIRRRTDKDGAQIEEIESVSKLRALELDAKLAGEIDGKNGDDRHVMINIGILTQ